MLATTVGRNGRTLVAAVAVGALCAAGVAAERADAVPIRDLRPQVSATRVNFTATIISPRSTKGCIANVQAAVVAYNPTRRLKSIGNTKVNVCAVVRNGAGVGRIRGFFGMGNIRAGRYAVCLRAVQDLRRGGRSAHTECKLFYWHGG